MLKRPNRSICAETQPPWELCSRGQIVSTSSHTRGVTGQTVNYFCPFVKGAVLSIVFFRPFHENDGCSFFDIFQSSKPNRFGSVCTVYTTLDRPYGQKTLHKHVRMYIRPCNAAVTKICFNHLMPGENRSVGVMISRECAQVHDMMYTVTFCCIDQ